MTELREVNRDNYDDVLDLSVADDQKKFVASNAYSLAQAYAQRECVPLAIYEDGELVGFCMYALDTDDKEYWLYRLMIDKSRQCQGIGRRAMEILIARIWSEHPERKIMYLSFEPENDRAKRVYERLGFTPDGRMGGGEVIYKLVRE